jgi:hypothetical protein
MRKISILCLLLAMMFLGGCQEKEVLVEEEITINMYYGDQIDIHDYLENLDSFYFDNNQKIEELTAGNHELYLHYRLKNDNTPYKQLFKINVKAVNLGYNMETKTINKGNYQIFNNELEAGVLENLDYVNNSLVLRDNQIQGSVTTPIYEAPLFSTIVASWNALTDSNNNIELMVRVRVDGAWSNYFSYRAWSKNKINYTIDTKDQLARISIDMIDILDGKYADAFQIKVFLRRDNLEISSPILKMFSVALDLKDESTFVCEDDYYQLVDIPKITQMDEPEIGNIICSPTSTTMMLNYLGIDITKGDFARMARDNRRSTIYGNWTYNVAAAGELGVNAYVAKITMEELKAFIASNQAVVVSIRSTNSNPLTGAPQQYPSGHLMVVKGFTIIDGVEYVVVNDPADPNVENVEHLYRVNELNNTWKGYSYIIYK